MNRRPFDEVWKLAEPHTMLHRDRATMIWLLARAHGGAAAEFGVHDGGGSLILQHATNRRVVCVDNNPACREKLDELLPGKHLFRLQDLALVSTGTPVIREKFAHIDVNTHAAMQGALMMSREARLVVIDTHPVFPQALDALAKWARLRSENLLRLATGQTVIVR